jgi:hypothetical protein
MRLRAWKEQTPYNYNETNEDDESWLTCYYAAFS